MTEVRGHDTERSLVLQFFGTVLETFTAAAGQLMDRIKTVLPEGSTQCRIRFTARETHTPTTGTLLDTLGEETAWLRPPRYNITLCALPLLKAPI